MRQVHLVVPDGVFDGQRPSGGNAYDLRLGDELALAGWAVHRWEVAGDWPEGGPVARAALARVLADLADGALVLVDGLVGSLLPEILVSAADRLRLAVLLHMPLGGDREAAVLSAAAAVITTSTWSRDAVLACSHVDEWTRHLDSPDRDRQRGAALTTHLVRSVRAERVHVARPGADIGELATGSVGGGELLCVAAVVPGKGHDVLVEALAAVADRRWRCTFVGSLLHDALFVAGLRDRVARLGIADRIKFTGPLTGDRLAASYGAADVLVLATLAESFGMVVTEALAHGLPAVVSDVGGVREALGVVPGRTPPGMLVPPGDPVALADALRSWLDDSALRERLREAARQRRTTLPGWSETSAQVTRVLEAVAG